MGVVGVDALVVDERVVISNTPAVGVDALVVDERVVIFNTPAVGVGNAGQTKS